MRQAESQFVPDVDFANADAIGFAAEGLAPSPILITKEIPVESWRYQYVKRGLDIVGSMILIALLAIPSFLVALAILITSPGSIFYREERIGRYGRRFRIWKFRSMYRDAGRRSHVENAGRSGNVIEWRMQKQKKDPRITPVGAFIRRWSLDEIPQLLNVLCGEMSLIGPRPIVDSEAERYNEMLYFYLAATPGMSGLWQVSGRCEVDYDERRLLDASYVQSWSLGFDLILLVRTIPAVLSRVGAV